MKTPEKKTIKSGIYLVIDPSMPDGILLPRLKEAAGTGKICAVQLWDHWEGVGDKQLLIGGVKKICNEAAVPLLMNNDWRTALQYELDGIHFDALPREALAAIREKASTPVLIGITLGNDLSLLSATAARELDYLSFCSVFPSSSAGACEIVSPETIRKAGELTDLPVFLSGGINVSSIPRLSGLPFRGVAVISGIMGSDSPATAIAGIDELLNKTKMTEL